MASVNTPPASAISLAGDWSRFAKAWLASLQEQPASAAARPKRATTLRMKLTFPPTPPATEHAVARQASDRAIRFKLTQKRGFVWSPRQ